MFLCVCFDVEISCIFTLRLNLAQAKVDKRYGVLTANQTRQYGIDKRISVLRDRSPPTPRLKVHKRFCVIAALLRSSVYSEICGGQITGKLTFLTCDRGEIHTTSVIKELNTATGNRNE